MKAMMVRMMIDSAVHFRMCCVGCVKVTAG